MMDQHNRRSFLRHKAVGLKRLPAAVSQVEKSGLDRPHTAALYVALAFVAGSTATFEFSDI